MPEVAQEQCCPSQPGHAAMGSAAIPGVSPGHGKWAGCTHRGAGSTVTREMCTTMGYICSRGQPLSAADVCTAQPNRAHTHTDMQQHSHSTQWFTQIHTTPGEGTWLYRMFNHVSSRKLFFIKRDYNRFHLTSKTFSTVQRCPLRSTSGAQQSGFKLQIRPLLKGGRSMQ